MNSRRVFRQVMFGRKLNVKRLRAALSRTMREVMKDTPLKAVPVRVESILIETDKTTVFLSGNGPGLDAVAAALRSNFSDVKISNASRGDASRPPRRLPSSPEAKRK